MGFEKVEGHVFLAFAQDVEREEPGFLDDRMRPRVRFHAHDDERWGKSGLRDPIDRCRGHRTILALGSEDIESVWNHPQGSFFGIFIHARSPPRFVP